MDKDIKTKNLIGCTDVFADIANANGLLGSYFITPDELTPEPTEYNYRDAKGKARPIFRDIMMKVNGLNGCIALVGYENQEEINNIMPVRSMGYDYTAYMKQIHEIKAQNKKDKNSAYTKEIHDYQKLLPVATYVLYFGDEEWNTPLSLLDMLDIQEEDKAVWEGIINNYTIKVIHMTKQSKEVIDKYTSDFGIIARYMAYKNDKELLYSELKAFEHKIIHTEEVYDMLRTITNDKRTDYFLEEVRNSGSMKGDVSEMCEFFDYLESIGEARGEARGEAQGKRGLINNMLKNGMSIEEISKFTDISVEDITKLLDEKSVTV